MLTYQQTIIQLLGKNPDGVDWNKQYIHFNAIFTHFQYERIIHLMVSLVVGLACLISCLSTLSHPLFPLYLIDIILGILFLAYLNYYRRLENTAQSWYPIFHQLQEKMTRV